MGKNVELHYQELIKKAQEGDDFAFRALVDKHKERAVRLAYSMTGNLTDAQDIAQEAFITIYNKLKNFRFDSKFSTWIYRIVVNKAYDLLRRRQRSSINFDKKVLIENLPEKDKANNPRDLLISNELTEQINYELNFLPKKQQIAFILKHKEGMKIKQIALLMKISQSSVKAHLFRAVNKLQGKLKRCLG